jgi:excisionase family DNA binding protein
MTHKELRSLLLKRMKELERWYSDDPPDPDKVADRERAIVYEVASEMALAGFHRLHAAGLTLRFGDNTEAVKTYLSRCLGALQSRQRTGSKGPAHESNMLTPPEVARQYGVSPDTVRAWITSGDLRAVSIGKGKRPRYRVPREALTELDAKRLPPIVPSVPPQRRRRPKPTGLIVTRFSSGH